MISRRGAALALAWMAAGCACDDAGEQPLPMPPPAPVLLAPRPVPSVATPPALKASFESAVAGAVQVAGRSDDPATIADLRRLTRSAEVSMAVLQRTPPGPHRAAALARAREDVGALAAALAR
jgi:hypothetical protein